MKLKAKRSVSILFLLLFAISLFSNQAFAYGSDKGRIVSTELVKAFVYQRDGSSSTNIYSSDSNASMLIYPSWSPDGKKIIMVKGPLDGSNTELATINPDGSGLQNITDTENYFEEAPVYSPDGKYVRYVRVPRDLATNDMVTIIRNMQTSEEVEVSTKLVEAGGSNPQGLPYIFQPWSPDSSKLLVQNIVDGGRIDYYVVNKDGSNPVLVSGGDPTYYMPTAITWIDSNRILVKEYGDGNISRLMLYNLSSQSSTVISNSNFYPTVMEYMPEKNHLVFSGSLSNAQATDPQDIKVFSVDFNQDLTSLGTPVDLTKSVCPGSNQNCTTVGSPFFSISNSSVVLIGGYDNGDGQYTMAQVVVSDSGVTTLKQVNIDSQSIQAGPIAPIIYFNDFEPVNDGGTTPPTTNPNPPKTGAALGAGIMLVSLLGLSLLVTKSFIDQRSQKNKSDK